MSALYTVLIYPLELFFEVVFSIANRIVSNPGWAIIVLSLAVNFFVLPLYKRADEVQREERELEDSLAEGIDHIKKTFKGDERMMMLQTFYEQNNYSPLFVLKGSVSLLLQIPFFMAAYNFLSHLQALNGTSFGPIQDLGVPDKMITLGTLGINVLPIVMTLINLISGYIYTRGLPVKSKIQLYAMALLFLVLLYNSPSGLAFYWTLNNVFSLLKNIVYKIIGERIENKQKKDKTVFPRSEKTVFVICSVLLTVLIGLLIPSAVIKSSPSDFINIINPKSPNRYIIHSGLIAAGFFVVWCNVFFHLFDCRGKALLSRLLMSASVAALIDYMFFGTELGNLSSMLVYDVNFGFSIRNKILNILILAICITVIFFMIKKVPRLAEGIVTVLLIVFSIMCAVNIYTIETDYRRIRASVVRNDYFLPLSSEGKNVMVFMVDMAPAYYVPIIFDEIPSLEEQFDGFVYYPNALSFGAHTKHASPALFGGYDYTPQLIVADEDKSLRQTQDEALSVMPLIFADNGFEVTVIDPPFAGYTEPPDLRIFDYPGYNINAYCSDGRYDDINDNGFDIQSDEVLFRNFFCYSVMKASPIIIQNAEYDMGRYNNTDCGIIEDEDYTIPQVELSPSSSEGVNQESMVSYQVVSGLTDITEVENSDENTFAYMVINSAHEPMLYQAPDYVPRQYVDNTEYDVEHTDRFNYSINGYSINPHQSYNAMRFYTSNAATYVALGQYFDYLRETGVWDNTRIILVADHSIPYMNFPDTFNNTYITDMEHIGMSNLESFNPLLMVKDFGASGFDINTDIVTNADVPYLALNGLVNDPVNPFTGNPIVSFNDYNGAMVVYDSYDVNITDTDFDGDATRFDYGYWYEFTGTQVFDTSSWRLISYG